jgi:purine-binding chemotaxis protein CheW
LRIASTEKSAYCQAAARIWTASQPPEERALNDEGTREVLVFEVERQRYAIFSAAVVEILRAVAVAPLPGAPAVVDGVIDLRGRFVPVLDLRVRFGLPRAPVNPSEHFVIARSRERLVTLRADRVLGLAVVDRQALADSRAAGPRVAHIAGIARLPDGLAVVYDLPAFLDEAEAITLDRALAATTAGQPPGPAPAAVGR